jgi:hypothetical protein
MLRVALLLPVDYQHFGVGATFGRLLAGRLLFLIISAWVLVALRGRTSPAAAGRLFFHWGFLLVAMTVCALAARPPGNHGLLLMSFAMVIVTYGLAPLPLCRQAILTLTYSAAALYVARQADGVTLAAAAAVHVLSHLFGAVLSWHLNRRRRETFLGALREADLRTGLEAALAEVRTLRGMLCICAWCKRVRDEAAAWESVDSYVQSRTHATFSHGICPDCLQSQVGQMAGAHA